MNLQQKAFYNLGNTQFELAKSAKDLDGLQSGLETAEKSFEHAVELDKNDPDARTIFVRKKRNGTNKEIP